MNRQNTMEAQLIQMQVRHTLLVISEARVIGRRHGLQLPCSHVRAALAFVPGAAAEHPTLTLTPSPRPHPNP
jgi:hypothetical protein